MMATVEFRLLGPVEAWRGTSEIALDGPKQRTVLAALLLSGKKLVSDEELGSVLWGENAPATFNAQIYTYVSRLRKYLRDAVKITRKNPGYSIVVNYGRLDVDEFEACADLGDAAMRAGDFEGAVRHYRAGLAHWRGPALTNTTDHLVGIERQRLEETRLAVQEACIDAEVALGASQRLVPELTGLVARYPLRETFRSQLMIALYRCTRQADALAVYEEGRRLLADELGVDPGTAMRRVHLAVLGGERWLSEPSPSRKGTFPHPLAHPYPQLAV
ncbi:AfsR/SARP family transcriptional regulator [Spirillospora sp. NPDC047279]|uniref:AfsR/SARP family transcriptional regulator n=1 Tax=Spirillospora sp. NPDC047279 TaxID=3155478 RepID=UPI0033CDA8A1